MLYNQLNTVKRKFKKIKRTGKNFTMNKLRYKNFKNFCPSRKKNTYEQMFLKIYNLE